MRNIPSEQVCKYCKTNLSYNEIEIVNVYARSKLLISFCSISCVIKYFESIKKMNKKFKEMRNKIEEWSPIIDKVGKR